MTMGRSVSTPSEAVQTAFASTDIDDEYDFRDAIDNLKGVAQHRMPSLYSCDEWIGREDHAILQNDHAYIGVSEYCGLVAVWVVPKDGALAEHWCSQINLRPLAECFGQGLRRQGTFSNGEAIFQPLNGKQQGKIGLGFSSKEGWL
jgi:hypothetical protein